MTTNMKMGRIGNATFTYDGRVIDLGRKVSWNRSMNEWTQKELAQRAGISVTYLQKIELNKINPSPKVVEAIAYAFGMTTPQMLGV